METQSLIACGNIKQEPDWETARNGETNMQLILEQIKAEPDDDSYTVRMETRDRGNDYMYPVTRNVNTPSTSHTFLEEGHILYCEKCQLKYEGDCPEHGPLIYIDNAEANQGQSCNRKLSSQVADNMDGQVTKRVKVEQSDGYSEYEESHSSIQGYVLNSEYFHMIQGSKILKPKTSNKLVDVNNEHSDVDVSNEHSDVDVSNEHSDVDVNNEHSDVDVSNEHNDSSGGSIKMEDGRSVEQIIQLNDTELQMSEEKVESDCVGHDEKSAEFCDAQDCYAGIVQSGSTESGELLSDVSVHIDNACMSYELTSCVGNKKHEKIRIVGNAYTCSVCGFVFGLRHPLRTGGKKSYKCEVCDEDFTCFLDLRKHKKVHKDVKPYKCEVCSARFVRLNDLCRHHRVHTGEKPYKCEVCNVAFSDSGRLKTHKRIHTGEKPFGCDVCGMRFAESGPLKRHMRIHTGEKPYKCDVCGKGFAQCSVLKNHKRVHTGEKPYKCDVCGVGFSHSCHLKSHKRVHTGEKPYKCDVCGARFTDAGPLKRHSRIHTGEKPYRCDICGVAFAQCSILKGHKRVHTGERPHKCDVCGIAFTRPGPLKRHKETHTEVT